MDGNRRMVAPRALWSTVRSTGSDRVTESRNTLFQFLRLAAG